ncbi:guanine deaminase-like [Glandiceps talaboti]
MSSGVNIDQGEHAQILVFCGPVIHSTKVSPLIVFDEAVLGVKDNKIIFLENKSELSRLDQQFGFSHHNVRHLKPGQFLIPGFVDTHIHASQYVMAGTAMDLPLMEWFDKYKFPVEAKFKDTAFAERAYEKAVGRVLKFGTTTASYYTTCHTESTLTLADVVVRAGQRAYIGKTTRTINASDDIETKEQAMNETKRFIDGINQLSCHRVAAAITPSSALDCHLSVLTELADLTHLAESKPLIPGYSNFTDIYHKANALTEKNVFAHCIHLYDSDIKMLKEANAGVSHCPNSNITLQNGLLDVRKLLDQGIKVGLGTDVSGGYSPSILDAIRYAVGVSKLLAVQKQSKDYVPITVAEAFRMATLGGSQVLGLEDKIGNFEVGKEFDALLIDTKCEDSPFDTFDDDYQDSFMDAFQKFLFLGDDRNITEVYVAGKKILQKGSV